MKTVNIDVERLGPVRLRQVPTINTRKDGTPVVNDKGEPVISGEVILPGFVGSANAFRGAPRIARLGWKGARVPDLPGGLPMVELPEGSTLTKWYEPSKRRGELANTGLTVGCASLTLSTATRARDTRYGFLPITFTGPVDEWVLLDVEEIEGRDRNSPFNLWASIAVPPSIVSTEGVIRVDLEAAPHDDLFGAPVSFDGLHCKWQSLDDRREAGRYGKAQMWFAAQALVPAASAPVVDDHAGRTRPARAARPAGDLAGVGAGSENGAQGGDV